MKINLFTLSFIFLAWGCANNEQLSDSDPQETNARKSEDLAKMQLRGDLVYLQNTESPFTGKAQAEYPDGQIRAIARFEDGELKKLKRWRPNGTAELELEFIKGEVTPKDPESYESSSSFVLIPPPAILNLKSVERDSHLTGLILKHTQGLNSLELRAKVLSRLDQPEYKMVLLAPFAMEGIRMELGSSFSYDIEVGGRANRPRFVITAQASSARGAMIVADLVQHEYEKLHRTEMGQKVELVKQTLESLLENSLAKERAIASEMAAQAEDEKRLSDDAHEKMKTYERELAVVRKSTDAIRSKSNEVKIEQALPSTDKEPLRKESMALLPSSPLPALPQPRIEEALLGAGMTKENMPWQPNGSFTEFHENGKKKTEGTFRKGKKSGLWVSYDQDGKEINRKSFQGG
jgi:hypothetical protein